MPGYRYLPPVAATVALWRLLSGRVRFPKDSRGRTLTMEDGQKHIVFREMRVAPSRPGSEGSMTVLKVRFRFARFSPAVNRRLSLIPIPVIAGMPGLRRKIWTLCEESGVSQGLYQFESPSQAEGYLKSAVMRALERRSVPGSTSHEILNGTLIDDYLDHRSPLPA